MTYNLKRTTTAPNSPMRVMISDPANGDLLNSGGTFYFMPAGQDGDNHDVNEYVATEVMADKSMAVHFECTPPAPTKHGAKAAAHTDASAAASKQAEEPKQRGRKRHGADGDQQ